MEIFAHRGASSTHPENTLAAFEAAAKLGVDGIEFDVQLTKDEVPVVIHDFTIDRTTNGTGSIADLSLAELRQFSAGRWFAPRFASELIPTLDDVLEWAQSYPLTLNIELKGTALDREKLAAQVRNRLQTFKMNRVILSSFDHQLVQSLAKIDHIETAIIVRASLHQPLKYLTSVGAQALHYYYPMMKQSEVKELIDDNIFVRPYTVNDEEQMKRCMEMNCSSIFTDHPKLARSIREGQ
ncbi:glycerophosphodiester phosphodiesterase [Desertibacillus haloalkaliphilus]|uniref:glycerophosphodiester phosphodiesterase n=1 Tax=Desertibacillus haloalkaliphilus TaxID=1328930 RepID=UPI001FEB968C|nr:glycerophosphodiester phosphodiesterase [Desertibacillus haloalkaliphilus]